MAGKVAESSCDVDFGLVLSIEIGVLFWFVHRKALDGLFLPGGLNCDYGQ